MPGVARLAGARAPWARVVQLRRTSSAPRAHRSHCARAVVSAGAFMKSRRRRDGAAGFGDLLFRSTGRALAVAAELIRAASAIGLAGRPHAGASPAADCRTFGLNARSPQLG